MTSRTGVLIALALVLLCVTVACKPTRDSAPESELDAGDVTDASGSPEDGADADEVDPVDAGSTGDASAGDVEDPALTASGDGSSSTESEDASGDASVETQDAATRAGSDSTHATWTQDFEGSTSGWTIEGGVWQFGRGGSNEPAPKSGNAFAGTVLNGRYPPNADARLISPEIVVPPSADNSRFKYSYWYDFSTGAGDYGQLQIRVVGGDWQDVAGGRLEYQSEAWSQRIVDLRPYAGRTVQLAFRIVTDAMTGYVYNQGFGWYVDDVSVETGAYVFHNPESFEGDVGDWSVEGGLWTFMTGNVNEPAARTGKMIAGTVPGGYSPNADARLISPEIVVPAGAGARSMTLYAWWDFGTNTGDYGHAQVRTLGGQWQDVGGKLELQNKLWTEQVIDLADYKGQTVQVGFRVVTDGMTGYVYNQGFGWYVDDVTFQGF